MVVLIPRSFVYFVTREWRENSPAESVPGLPGLAVYEVGGFMYRRGYRVEPIESRTLAGRKIPGYAITTPLGVDQRIWSWENIALRWEDVGYSAMQATSLELDIPIPEEMFEVPADVVITSE
jgi:hypothetical protein